MLGVQQGSHQGIQSHRLTLACCSGNQQVRSLGKVKCKDVSGNGLANGNRKSITAFLAARLFHPRLQVFQTGHHGNHARLLVGNLYSYGIGARKGDNPHALCR